MIEITDEERRIWAVNEAPLYLAMRADNPGKKDGQYNVKDWVKRNEKLIDTHILSFANKMRKVHKKG